MFKDKIKKYEMKAETKMAVSSSFIFYFIFFFIFTFSLTSINAGFGYDYLDHGDTIQEGSNYTINVNNSQYLQSLTPQQVANLYVETDPRWTANYTAFNTSWSNRTNSSYVPYIGANQNVNLGSYNITSGTLKPNLNNDLGTGGTYWKNLYLSGDFIDALDNAVSIFEMFSAYTHSIDNSRAHSDYLINNGNDATTGNLNATGNMTATYFVGNGSRLTSVCLANGTNCASSSSGNFVPYTGANQTVYLNNQTLEIMNTKGKNVTLNNFVEHTQELMTDTLLDKSSSQLSCTGGVLNYTLIAFYGCGQFNFNGTLYPTSGSPCVSNATVSLVCGTDISPVTNYIYWELVADIPTMKVSSTYPSTNHIDVGTFVVGACSGSSYNIYSYSRNRYEVDSFVKRSLERIEESGTLYVSGFVPWANTTFLNVSSGGEFFNNIFEMTSTNLVKLTDGFIYINGTGHFKTGTDLTPFIAYANGVPFSGGVNERINIVWGLVPINVTGGLGPTQMKLVAVLPNEPSVKYNTVAEAQADIYSTTNYYPPNTELKKVFIPIARTIMKPSGDVFEPFSFGLYYQDIRGKVTSGGGSSVTIDTSGFLLKDGSTKLTGDWDVGNYNITNISQAQINDNLTINKTTFKNNILTINPNIITTIVSGIINVLGTYTGSSFYILNFNPNVTASGGFYGFNVVPNIATNVSSAFGINFQPTYAGNVVHRFLGINTVYPTHTNNFADTLSVIDESTTRQYINTNGKIDINTISIGEALTYINVGGGEPDYEENMITLTGGVPTEVGATLSPIQRGIKFVGFESKGTNSTVEAIHMSGGDINIDDDGSFIKMGEDQDALIRFDGTNLNINMTTNGALTIYNTTGLGKIRANQYATSTPFDTAYNISNKYIDTLPNPENLLDVNGKIKVGALRNSQTTWLEKDPTNCWSVGSGEYWYVYDIVGTKEKSYSYTKINLTENPQLRNEQYVEIIRQECGTKSVNVTLIDTQAFENTIMISELNQKVNTLQTEINRIKNCTRNSIDYRAYQVCVNGGIIG